MRSAPPVIALAAVIKNRETEWINYATLGRTLDESVARYDFMYGGTDTRRKRELKRGRLRFAEVTLSLL